MKQEKLKIIWYTHNRGKAYLYNKLVAYVTRDANGNIIYK